jgi:hypothetical protein
MQAMKIIGENAANRIVRNLTGCALQNALAYQPNTRAAAGMIIGNHLK